MSHEIKLHQAQTTILRELLFHPSANFAALQKPTNLTSDHFNFHIAKLKELGFVEKIERGQYRLTIKGKEYANRLDTDRHTVERQPKCAVILVVERDMNGRREFLFQERLKNPYFGFWGLPTGKISWGEKIAETAERELMEEAGLEADWRVSGVYHEHVIHADTGEKVEDKVFFVVHGLNASGDLIENFEGGHNEWMTHQEAFAKPKKFLSFETELKIVDSNVWFHEAVCTYTAEEF